MKKIEIRYEAIAIIAKYLICLGLSEEYSHSLSEDEEAYLIYREKEALK